MNEWALEELWEESDDDEFDAYAIAALLADRFFLSDNALYPSDEEGYRIGYLSAEDWLPIVRQLDGIVTWPAIIAQAQALEPLVELSGLPTELLEAPLEFLESALDGELPSTPAGRKVDSRRLVKIARWAVRLAQDLPDAARAAVQAWANVHRARVAPFVDSDFDEEDLVDLLFDEDLPPAVAGFGMMIGMTLSRWPERGEGLPLPPEILDRASYAQVLADWEALPDSPTVTEEGFGDAEDLFAQGQLAHTLARMGSIQGWYTGSIEDGDVALAYARLSRAILWVHHQCRHCPERDGVACTVAATGQSGPPAPLLDVAAQIADVGRIEGCIKM